MAGKLARAFGKATKKYRTIRSMSQAELSTLTGISTKTLSQIETGVIETNLGMVELIATALATPPREFFDEFSNFTPFIPEPTPHDAIDILSRLIEDYRDAKLELELIKKK